MNAAPGRLFAGTSGFAYPAWSPRFYGPGRSGRRLLPEYAARLPAVELHNTFYRRPDPATVERWLREVPPAFRFCPKAQRGVVFRAWSAEDGVAAEALHWLGASYAGFADRLGCVLLSAPGRMQRDDEALSRLLDARPPGLRLALELPHPTWSADEVHALLASHAVPLVAADYDGADEPDLRRIGPVLYLRLRRVAYTASDIERWADRLRPFLDDGMDAYAFFRHDADGQSALHAEALLSRLRQPAAADGEAAARG